MRRAVTLGAAVLALLILVDLGDCAERLRDGIYVLRADDALVVRLLRKGVFSIGQFGDQATGEALKTLLARLEVSVPG